MMASALSLRISEGANVVTKTAKAARLILYNVILFLSQRDGLWFSGSPVFQSKSTGWFLVETAAQRTIYVRGSGRCHAMRLVSEVTHGGRRQTALSPLLIFLGESLKTRKGSSDV